MLSCARVGSPVGGIKDSIAPSMVGSNIDSGRINVPRDLKELRIDFDEYITLDKISKNLIISPPIKRIKKILPSSLANKYILIQWSDTLQANTTYNFNFGNAIKDNNEGNVLRYFNFAFSTGNKIDDQYIAGEITNKVASKSSGSSSSSSSSEKSTVIGLYKVQDTMNYKEKPYYVTMADLDGYYELNFLSPGKYRLLAFEDLNGNTIFDTGAENVGFLKDPLVLDSANISGKNISLYPSVYPFKYLEMTENPGGILMKFQGNPDKVEIRGVDNPIKEFKVSHRPKSDSVFVWFDAKKENVGIEKSDNLKFSFDTGVKQDTVSVFYRMNQKNEMQISNTRGSILPPKSDFVFNSNYVLDKLNTEKWSLVSDSISQPFTARISETNPFEVVVSSEFKEGKKYSLTVLSKTVSSYFETLAKPYRFDFEAGKSENYGTVTLKLTNAPKSKYWLQLINSKSEPIYSRYTTGDEVKFEVVKPDTYGVRILVDNNENGYWDPADFFTDRFAEDIFEFDKKVTARPMWDVVEPWDLNALPRKPGVAPLSQPILSKEPSQAELEKLEKK